MYVVSRHIFHFICKHEGCSDYGQVERSLRQSFTVADQVLSQVLDDHQRFVIVQDDDSSPRSSKPDADSLILAKTSLRLSKHDKCPGCEDLHLCRYFVCGNCRFGTKCKNSHDLTSAHNSDLLKKHDLHGLASGELFQLLLQNDPSLLPEVCFHYNKGKGEYGSCKYKTSCGNLHLCLHFLQDDCKFGAACKRTHSFNAHALKILNTRGLSSENMRKLLRLYKSKLLIASSVFKKKETVALPEVKGRTRHKSSGSVSESDQNEICLFFIRTGCSFKDKCVRFHHHLPYKWQILQKDGITWSDLPNEEEVEKAYCSPANVLCINESSTGHQVVDFMSMTCGVSDVRRLSTASSVTKPPHFILTTEWIWYWRNDKGGWTEYGKGEDPKFVASVTSEDLEKHYLADSEKEISFTSQNHQYILKFKEMCQRNLKHKTERDVRRRPRFVSAQDVKSKIKGSESPDSSASSSVEVPPYWDKGALDNFTYKIVPLQSTLKEYQRVGAMFSRTLPKSVIRSIERVQNLSLWKVFQWQKEQMNKRNGGSAFDQRYLFHGTDESLIAAICEQNFDWRMCGSHGTLYGKGSYFARDSSYSDRYAKSRNGKTKKMFVALVLVGNFTRGNNSLVRPPQKPTSQGFYDSCVDNEANPAIFVVFEKFQVYPEYIIEYS
ncbi:protein mono-ADP-ribosyltransferase PARP12-like isoform X1 [Carassius gibelio]|uniref:protein mono-ADP-ribosyltransferase PARP12-like isoform X1 n=1 Tax=Carassius gibelio TaxID=101364 RepID=UPI0022791DC2|nr:protein mono-ADP-ribosyltransferase PARP12-like isoform X1 [Carassius gibelio]